MRKRRFAAGGLPEWVLASRRMCHTLTPISPGRFNRGHPARLAMSDYDSAGSEKFRSAFVVALVVVVSVLFLAMVGIFLKSLLLAAIFTVMMHPVQRRLLVLFRGRAVPAALATVLLVIGIILGPATGFLGIVANQAIEISETLIPWIKEHLGAESYEHAKGRVLERAPFLADFLPDRDQLAEGAADLMQAAGQFLVMSASKMTAGTATFFLNLFVMLYAMYYFLIHGRGVLEKILYYCPLGPDEEERMLERLRSVTRATIKGTILIGIIQGSLGGLGFYVAGLAGAAFWGTIMIILSIVPGIGAMLVWLPAVLYLLATGDVLKGLVLGAYMGAVVGSVDNLLRPAMVGRDARMPDLLILLGTLGGIFMFGIIGFIIGPVICGLFLTVWEIYGETFKSRLPPVRALRKVHGESPDPSPP